MGAELLAGDVGNPHGYFEDALVHDFHRRVMREAGIADGFTVRREDLPIAISPEARSEATEIARAAGSRTGRWGWKEPRTALFLDLWAELLPDSVFLFLFRKPEAVVDSLMRRASNPSIVEDPTLALEIWLAHNDAMLTFSEQAPERCAWLETESFVSNPELLIDRLRDWSIPADDIHLGEVLVEADFHREVRMRARRAAKKNKARWSAASEMYERLRSS